MTAPQPPAPEPQPIVTPLRTAAIFLVLTINPGAEDTVRGLLEDVAGLQRAVGFRLPEADLSAVAGIGSDAWDRLFSGPKPAGLHPFRELQGPRHRAVATPGDLLFHLRADQMGLCFEFATQVMNRLAGYVTVQDEVHGFWYFDERDLMGFVDGTEHQILRSNMPFGAPGSQEFGTYYIGYAASASVTEQMLENMFIGNPPGNTDRILDFSTALTGTLFFAPSADFLDGLPDAPGTAGASGAGAAGGTAGPGEAVTTSQSSGSLGIGSLRSTSQ